MADLILVTGASGFIGSALCRRLEGEGLGVQAAVRDRSKIPVLSSSEGSTVEWVVLHDQSSDEETRQALKGVQTVFHLAARVHVMKDHAADPLGEFRRVNREWTERLARLAAEQGMRRFVYLSSIKVNGEESETPLTEQDVPRPQDPYGISKWEAEQALAAVSSETGLETVVIRSPLVYGPGVGGNFLSLLKLIQSGLPLPLGSVRNRRSLIYRENLVDGLMACVREPRAVGQTYLVSDGEDLSTPDLIRRIACVMGRSVQLWPVPMTLLRVGGVLVGQRGAVARLTGSLQIDSSKIRRELGWSPPRSVDQGIKETVAWFLKLGSQRETGAVAGTDQ
ncbi:MAG: SDR family oxidoreductase [Nitrospira sp.]|nr:SDR family oxidoreductase [Nitrospira sp.]